MEISLSHQPEPISFRFFADFEIKINSAETTGFTSQQRGLLDAIAASSPMMRQVARMALETDLADIRGRHLTNLFQGPYNNDILDCILPCLSDNEKVYWGGLRAEPGDALHEAIVPVFLAFEVKLRRAGITEMSDAPTPIRKTVGPTLDAINP
jgi:hypothetical protein